MYVYRYKNTIMYAIATKGINEYVYLIQSGRGIVPIIPITIVTIKGSLKSENFSLCVFVIISTRTKKISIITQLAIRKRLYCESPILGGIIRFTIITVR